MKRNGKTKHVCKLLRRNYNITVYLFFCQYSIEYNIYLVLSYRHLVFDSSRYKTKRVHQPEQIDDDT